MSDATSIILGQSFDGQPQSLLLNRANRHGIVAGATGTGKTVTLQIMAQGFADAGVPVFCADVKGDLSGISQAGGTEKFAERAAKLGVTLHGRAAPTVFWDLYGEKGHPIRATVSDVGPLLLAQMLQLNEVQEGVLSIAFHVADKEGLLLLDLEDLRALLTYLSENAKTIGAEIGSVSPQSVAAIQRSILQLEQQGAKSFFGEPALRLDDLIKTPYGMGQINVLDATRLMNSPRLYSAFLLWLLSELFEQLPEIGDPDKPRLVFFFDEAHLLFNDAPKGLLEKIEQVVRLIRSKGVGVYFVTQNPADIPDTVLAQLGNRVQHALRAYTPAEQKGLRAAAQSFRTNPGFDTAEAIQALGVGEALVSLLDEKGAPTVVAQTKVRPPDSRLGPANDAERAAIIQNSPVRGVYDTAINRESAEEVLKARKAQALRIEADTKAAEDAEKARAKAESASRAPAKRGSSRQTPIEALTKSVLRTAGSTITRELLRGVMGSLKKR